MAKSKQSTSKASGAKAKESKTSSTSANGQGAFSLHVSRGIQEGALIGLAALSIYLFLALFSYHPGDPGWASTGMHEQAHNAAGYAGAWSASFLRYFFGYVAYLFPALLAIRAWQIFRERANRGPTNWPLVALRVGGFVIITLTTTGLLASYRFAGLDEDAGGVLGAAIAHSSQQTFNLTGSTLLLVSFLLFGITVFTGLSWLKLMDQIGDLTLRGARFTGAQFKRATENVIQAFKTAGNLVMGRAIPFVKRSTKPLALLEHKRADDSAENAAKPAAKKTAKIEPVLDQPVAAQAAKPKPEPQAKKSIKILPLSKKVKPISDVDKPAKQATLFDYGAGDLPAVALLDPPDHHSNSGFTPDQLENLSRLLETKLADFGISAEVVEVNPGPVITRFEILPAAGVKVSRISNLVKDLARSLAVISVRVVEVIPGKPVVGIEIPNEKREIVRFSEVISSKEYDRSSSLLTLALGHDIGGNPVVANLAKMPHLLVAGTTGSGKSVGVNSMILSILFKATPEEVRLIMIDPKMLELSVYDDIPHLLTPVVTDMKEAANALRWCVAEMERRYKLMAAMGVRNIAGFNRKVTEARAAGEPILDPLWQPDELSLDPQVHPELETLPFIVVIIDEFADMMMIVGKKVEELIARIAQKARAAGIHLILATQRPSVDVITGLIKANVPTRIAFQVSSKVDSRTIIDQGGAEQLLGQGDMLYLPPGSGIPNRVHGAFVDDDEVHRVVEDWKQRGEPDYLEEVLSGAVESDQLTGIPGENNGDDSEQDTLYDEAVAFVTETRRVSISSVQRKLKIGYNRAANIVEAMEASGVISSAGHNGSREVLAPPPPKD